jgi:hypothetical protein
MKMKNKKDEQIALKKKHKESLILSRPEPTKSIKPSILIVCEGENTEPSYFRQFKLSSATIKPIGTGFNTVSLVEKAIELSNEKTYDQVWCVFDRDDFNESDFNTAIQLAEKKNIKVAYSNKAFEYWLILHLDDHQGGAMDRENYNKKINDLLKPFSVQYDGGQKGNKKITEAIFEVLDGIDEKTGKERKELAIARARKNYDARDHKNPAKEESSTTVFRLVEEILKYI